MKRRIKLFENFNNMSVVNEELHDAWTTDPSITNKEELIAKIQAEITLGRIYQSQQYSSKRIQVRN